MLDFVKSSSRTRASPPVLLDIGDNTLEDLPEAGEEAPPSYIVSCFIFCLFTFLCTNIFLHYEHKLSGITLAALTLPLLGSIIQQN